MTVIIRFIKILFLGQAHVRPPRHPFNEIQTQWDAVMLIWHNKKYKDFGLERITRLSLALLQFLFPGLYFKHYFSRYGYLAKKISIEVYVILKMLLPIFVLKFDWYLTGSWVVFLAIYMIAETIVYLASLIFFTHDNVVPSSYRRSLAALFLNYFQIVLDYAVIYAYCNHVYDNFFNLEPLTDTYLVYFSFATSVTVGYGDIVPTGGLSHVLVVSEIVLFFLFAALFLNHFMSKKH